MMDSDTESNISNKIKKVFNKKGPFTGPQYESPMTRSQTKTINSKTNKKLEFSSIKLPAKKRKQR
jgi:hypothetical protein